MSQPKSDEIELFLSMQTSGMKFPEEAIHVSLDSSTMNCQIALSPGVARSAKTLELLTYVSEAMVTAVSAYLENPDQYKKEEA